MRRIPVLVCIILVLSSRPTWAADSFYAYLTDTAKGADGAYLFKDRGDNPVYSIDENPVLFMHLPDGDKPLLSFWLEPDNRVYFGRYLSNSDSGYAYMPPWSRILDNEGRWWIRAYYSSQGNSETYSTLHSFSFAPEPLGCLLFIAGGCALALVRRKLNPPTA